MKEISPEWKANLSRLLKQLLEDKQFTQVQIADATQVSATTVSQWINRRQYPTEESRKQLARLLGFTPERLEAEIQGVPFTTSITFAQVADYLKHCSRTEFRELTLITFDRIQKEW
jgi:transcriptional regulator with XRE-family HTH domain